MAVDRIMLFILLTTQIIGFGPVSAFRRKERAGSNCGKFLIASFLRFSQGIIHLVRTQKVSQKTDISYPLIRTRMCLVFHKIFRTY